MTTRPTLGSNKSVGNTLGAAEWNLNVLQNGNWAQEVLLGTNADKIPGTAMANPLTLPGQVNFANDANLFIGLSGLNPLIQVEATCYLTLTRSSKTWALVANSAVALQIDSGGLLSGAGFYRSTEATITNGNTGTFAHGFGGGLPSFVHAVFGTVTNNNFSWGMGSVNNINATNITFLNSSGVTLFVKVMAIK